jgi:translation initiation factor 1
LRLETRRFTKTGTIIIEEGINPKQSHLPKMIKGLRALLLVGKKEKTGLLCCWETDHRDNLKRYLVKMGFNEDRIEVQ